jgi:hypothetical protein
MARLQACCATEKENGGRKKFACSTLSLPFTMMTVLDLNLFDFGYARCRICGLLNAMEDGVVHVDAMVTVGVHRYSLVSLAPYHILMGGHSGNISNFAERYWALKPNLHVVWESCLREFSQVSERSSNTYKTMTALLQIQQFWTDLPTVQQVMADAIATGIVAPWVRMHIMKKMDKQIWMVGCRRAWLLAVL